MPKATRKTHCHDPVRNAIVNFCENIDGAQLFLDGGSGGNAKENVNRAISDLPAVLSASGIRDLTVSVNALGRIEAFLDYADDLGEIRLTYTARTTLSNA
jgi:hypothetical protein